jgi:hypothetical protein
MTAVVLFQGDPQAFLQGENLAQRRSVSFRVTANHAPAKDKHHQAETKV